MGFWPVVDDVLRNSDILLLVCDARLPEFSYHKELERKVKRLEKPLVVVFTKIDLVSRESKDLLRIKYPDAFCVSGTQNLGISRLRTHLHMMGKRMKIDKPVIGVVGYPNLGKSALINVLARRAKTLVADKPGTTRGVQWVDAGSLRILDTPGVIPYEDKGLKLALLGSKHPDDISDPDRVALSLIQMFQSKDRSILEKTYDLAIEPMSSAYSVLLAIGNKHGFLLKGGVVDEHRTAVKILRDWHKGKLKL